MSMNCGNTEELWDLYTKEREKTGSTHKRADAAAMPKGRYRLAVHICIFNSKNQLLIQQRQPFKLGWPNMWDVSAAGSVIAGETVSQAAHREVLEELGISIDFSGMRPMFTMNFPGGFDDFYMVESDCRLAELHLQQEEVKQVRWADKDEVLRMQAQGTMIPYWFLDRMFDMRANYDAQGERLRKIKVGFAGFWHFETMLSLAEIIRDAFPGMQADKAMECFCDMAIHHMKQKSAVYAADGNMAVGMLLFSKEDRKICCLAVHPEYRRQKIASKMLHFMQRELGGSADISVETFREGDSRGMAARGFYQALGFVPGRLKVSCGYPVQVFTLKSFVEKD